MRIVSYIAKGAPSYGVVTADGIIDLKKRLGDRFADVRSLIAADGLRAARAAIASQHPDYSIEEVVLLPPVPDPEKLWCIGVNYKDRNAEYKDNSDLPKYPSLFVRNASSVVGSGQPVEKSLVSDQLDYEGELVLVIGKEGRHIPRERAFEHIFGMTLCNEGTIRDWLRHGKFNVTQGKNFDRSGSIGPWMVTADAIPDPTALELTTTLNGRQVQHTRTDDLIFDIPTLIAYISAFTELVPGDIISTGTPEGVGFARKPPLWLRPGDVVEVAISSIGTLRNTVADEA